MNAVLIIVAVAAVIVVVALLIWRGRGGKPEAGREDRRGEIRAAAGAPPAVEPRGGEARETVATPPRAASPAKREAVHVAEPAVVEPSEVKPPRPKVSESEIRDQVRTRLEAAERMLSELQEAAAGRSVEELTQSSGSVEIMAEGLQEVRALVERKQWSQAKNKGEALHAQLSLLLQSARREAAS